MHPPFKSTPLLVAWLIVACGATSDLEDEPVPRSDEEACILADDANWSGGDCGGAFDSCGLTVCETYLGEGCDCEDPDKCWDGTACVDP